MAPNPVAADRASNVVPFPGPRKVEPELIAALAAGDSDAITRTYREHAPKVRAYARRMLGDEAAARLGGQALLAQLLPDRAEFGGLVTNLERELSASGVAVRLGQRVDRAMVEALAPDAVVLATGALPARPDLELDAQAHVVDGADVLTGKARPGGRVLVADWRCDWTGIGLAGYLARRGHGVCLAVNGTHAGQNLPIYLHNHLIGVLHGLGIEVVPYARLFGADGDTAYLTHIVTGAPILREGIDTVVLAAPPAPDTALETELSGLGVEIRLAGDCLSPRSAEEAVYEGYLAGLSL